MARMSLQRSDKAGTRFSGKGIVLAIAAVLGAGTAVANAAVNMLHVRLPEAALAIDADDPVALIRDAQVKIVAGDENARTDQAVLSVVQSSVRELPINGPAFRLYGLNSATKADLAAMRAQMRLSDRMERRDVATQLWLIENSVEANDVNRALGHYDTALRIEESSRALLYPVLTDAMDSALIRKRFLPYLQANPPWLESFLRYAVSKTERPVSMAQLAQLNSGWPEGAAFSSLDTELLSRLVSNGDFSAAADHFRRIEGVDESILASFALSDASTNSRLAPIAWQSYSINGVQTFFLASIEGGGKVEIEAEAEAGFDGPIARKFSALKPGRYRLNVSMRAQDYSTPDVARWSLTCSGGNDGSPLIREEVAFDEEMALETEFIVPADCDVQYLLVSASTLVSTRYVKLVVASVDLTPLR